VVKNPKTGELLTKPTDYKLAERFIRKNWPELTIFTLVSNGGSASEAMVD